MGAIKLKTEVPGPKSKALTEERRKFVSSAVSEPRHGVWIDRAAGRAQLVDVDGNVFIDFAGGIGCLNAGHGAPLVVERAGEQLGRLQHTCFMTGPYEPYLALAKKLCQVVPIEGPKKAALFNSGAEAVENAVKVARRATGRAAVLALDPGFHGRTLLALSLTSKTTPYKDGFGPFAPEIYRFPLPDLRQRRETPDSKLGPELVEDLHRFLKSTLAPTALAAVIVEPVLGEGGFIVPPLELLHDLQKLAHDNGALFIADEVQTGFGRTGRMFASERFGLKPDLVILAKSLSNGLPLSALVGRAQLMDAPQPGGLGGTFGGNPISCAAALGSIETIERENLVARAESIGEEVGARFRHLHERFPFVGEARGVGAMRALELVKDRTGYEPDKARTERVLDAAARKGLLLLSAGLYGNVLRTLFPLSIPEADLREGLDVLEAALAAS